MNYKTISIFFLMMHVLYSFGFSQTTEALYMPKEIKQAYLKGSRSIDGKPGKNYFINRIDYKIKAEFDPETRELKGEELISYHNNSDDSLKKVYFNLYQDLYKKGNMRDWDISGIDIHNGVQITKIKYNGVEIEINRKNVYNYASILKIELPEYIEPKSEAQIEIHWNLILPGSIPVRMGSYGDKNYFIAYWFPKVAVYDDIEGWNTHGHSGMQEFYNDFGSYEVEITVPGKYNIWSTGVLQNAEELFTKKYLKRIKKSKESEEIVHIISEEDRVSGKIFKNDQDKIWKFKSEQTPDFAFAVSKSYLWDATSVLSGSRRISVNAVYKPDSKDFHMVADISRKVIRFFTDEIPGIPYPYPQLTAFNGHGGMEFPGMVNDGDASSLNKTIHLTAHEIGHSYFPFYTGLNEQKYAWMDEGLISFFPEFIVESYTEEENYFFFKEIISLYNAYGGSFNDVPLMIPSDNIGRYALRFHAYTRPATAFYVLYNYLGKDKFAKALQLFAKRWNGKHPTPYDFFYTFNEVAEEDLVWFWKPWFFEIGCADLSISKIEHTDNMKLIVNIENKGGFPVPVILKAVYKDNKTKEFKYPLNIWTNGKKLLKIPVPDRNLKKLILDSEQTPDAYPEDNIKEF